MVVKVFMKCYFVFTMSYYKTRYLSYFKIVPPINRLVVTIFLSANVVECQLRANNTQQMLEFRSIHVISPLRKCWNARATVECEDVVGRGGVACRYAPTIRNASIEIRRPNNRPNPKTTLELPLHLIT